MEKGKAEAVVIDAVEGIRRGLVQAKKGMGRSVDEVFDSIEEEAARDIGDCGRIENLGRLAITMPVVFPVTGWSERIVGRTPGSAPGSAPLLFQNSRK